MAKKPKIQPQSTSETSSLDPVTHYASEVLAGRILAGKLVRAACARHLADRQRSDVIWRADKAQWAINFFPEVLRLAEGEHAGKPFVLQLWQQFIVGSLFGWLGPDGFRRFRNAYVEIGKGNGKSPMAAGIGLYMMLADGEAGAHCYAAATTREQAGILFQDAVKMVDASPDLTAMVTKSGKNHVFNLAQHESGSFFRPVSSEGRALDGKRVHFAALDEIHEHPNATVVDKMRAGTKGRRQGLIFEITNSGYDRHTVCWHHHEYSQNILDPKSDDKNDAWFAYVCTLDEGDDWRDERVWTKVNPNLDISITRKYLREQVTEAEGMPSKQAIVERLNFCIWNEHANPWMRMDLWDACGDEGHQVDPEALIGESCYGGLDLARTRDLSAFVLIFPPSATHEDWKVLPFFWCAEDNIKERSKRDHVHYELWRQGNLITATPGNMTDFDFIETAIRELSQKYDVLQFGYDETFAPQLIQHLQEDHGSKDQDFAVKIPQRCAVLNVAIRMIERLVLGKELAHGGHPILRWNARNAVLIPDSNGNVRFDKARAIERIDGMAALANACWCANAGEGAGYTPTEVAVV